MHERSATHGDFRPDAASLEDLDFYGPALLVPRDLDLAGRLQVADKGVNVVSRALSATLVVTTEGPTWTVGP